MEALFENKYTRTTEFAKDVYGYLYFRRPAILFLIILFAIFFLIGIYNLIIYHVVNWYWIIAPLFWYAALFFIYKKQVNTVTKRDLELHGESVEITVTVTNDAVEQRHSNGAQFHLNYTNAKRAVQTGKYIYLWSKTNTVICFKKDAFTIGSAAELLSFLNSKGIKVK